MKNGSLFCEPCPKLAGSPCSKPQMMMLLKTRHKAKTLLSNQTPSGLSVPFQNFFWMDMLSKRKFFEVVFTKTGLVNRWKMHILVCCINQRTKTEFYSKGNLLIMAMGSPLGRTQLSLVTAWKINESHTEICWSIYEG